MIEMETSVEVFCIRIMAHPQVFGQKFTPIRRFLDRDLHPSAGFWASETHPFWPHISNMTQNGSAPRGSRVCSVTQANEKQTRLRIPFSYFYGHKYLSEAQSERGKNKVK